MSLPQSPLYAITDGRLLPGEKLFSGVAAALDGGCRWVQYRDKSGDVQKRLCEAAKLMELCVAAGAQLIINDDPQLAFQLGAGVHLGQGDADPAQARELLGPEAIIGVTCHDSLAFAQKAVEQGASYLAFGRFFPSNTKPDAPPAPLSLLNEVRQRWPHHTLVAIGGIHLGNGEEVLAAGADMLAVSEGLFAAEDIRERSRAFAALLRPSRN